MRPLEWYLCTNLGGAGNQFRAVTVGSPQSPMCGDWGEPEIKLILHLRKAVGWCKCQKWVWCIFLLVSC